MAQNSLVQKNADKPTEYECNGLTVKITPNIIRKYFVSGDGNITEEECVMFLNLCKYQRLNPYLREAHCIKYGTSPATMVTGKEVYTKRAMRNPTYAGQQAGVIVQYADGTTKDRIGALVLKNEQLVGAWAKVYVRNYEVPIEISVGLDEYIGLKKDGTVNQQWSKKPATMIRKVALVQALREAFPEDMQGLYSAEEFGVDEETLNQQPIENPDKIFAEAVETKEKPVEKTADYTGKHLDDDPFGN